MYDTWLYYIANNYQEYQISYKIRKMLIHWGCASMVFSVILRYEIVLEDLQSFDSGVQVVDTTFPLVYKTALPNFRFYLRLFLPQGRK